MYSQHVWRIACVLVPPSFITWTTPNECWDGRKGEFFAWPEGHKQFVAGVMGIIDNPSGPAGAACGV